MLMKTMSERNRCQKHPGYILKTLYVQPLSLTVTGLAMILGLSRHTISGIIHERKAVTPEIALRLSRAFRNTTPESWLNLQRNYDLWQVSHRSSAWMSVQSIVNESEKCDLK